MAAVVDFKTSCVNWPELDTVSFPRLQLRLHSADFDDLGKGHDDLLLVARECAREKSLQPLWDHDAKTAQIEDDKESASAEKSLDRLKELLEIEL